LSGIDGADGGKGGKNAEEFRARTWSAEIVGSPWKRLDDGEARETETERGERGDARSRMKKARR
jgi:hypothetical protein